MLFGTLCSLLCVRCDLYLQETRLLSIYASFGSPETPAFVLCASRYKRKR